MLMIVVLFMINVCGGTNIYKVTSWQRNLQDINVHKHVLHKHK